MVYPYELEWIEGAMIDQIRWILQGQALYAPPDIHFIPFAYTPVFFYLSAVLMKWVGIGFLAPRFISILAASGCILIIYQIVRRDTGRFFPAVIAAGIYAASFQLTGVWMDLAKVDSLFMLFVLAAFFFSRPEKHKGLMLISGMCFALAFFTKQLALPVILVFGPLSLWIYRGRTWPVWITTLLLICGIAAVSDLISSGWFSFYTFKTVMTHQKVSGWLPFLQAAIPGLWPSILLAVIFSVRQLRSTSPLRMEKNGQELWNTLGFCAALILTSWSIYFKIWTFQNDLIPAAAGLAIICGLCAGSVLQDRPKFVVPAAFALIVPGLLFLQLALLVYNPRQLIPTEKHFKKSEKIIQRTQSLPGEVLNFNRGYWNDLAEKNTYLHITPLGDVFAANFPPGSESFRRQELIQDMFQDLLSSQMFDWVIVDKLPDSWLPYYLFVGNFLRESGVNYPGRDQAMVPKYLLMKNPIAYGGSFPLDEPLFNDLYKEGWGKAAEGSRQIVAFQALLLIAINGDRPTELDLVVQPACYDGKPAVTGLKASWGPKEIGMIQLSACENASGRFTIPPDQIRTDEYNQLSFELAGHPDWSLNENESPTLLTVHELTFHQR